jgi:hypothetical protein
MYFPGGLLAFVLHQPRSEATGPPNQCRVEDSHAVPKDKDEEKDVGAAEEIKALHSVAGEPQNGSQDLNNQQAGQRSPEHGHGAADDRIRFPNAGVKKDDGRSKIEHLKSYEKNHGIHLQRFQCVSDHLMILTVGGLAHSRDSTDLEPG